MPTATWSQTGKGGAQRPPQPARRPAAGGQSGRGREKPQANAAKWVVYVVAGIILLNVIISILAAFFSIF